MSTAARRLLRGFSSSSKFTDGQGRLMELCAKDLHGGGFLDPARAATQLEGLPGTPEIQMPFLRKVADPNLTVLRALRLHEAAPDLLERVITERGDHLARLLVLLGGSAWWDDYLIVEPSRAERLWVEPGQAHQALLRAVDADPASLPPIAGLTRNGDDLRRTYREVLLDLAADNLARGSPGVYMPEVGSRLAELAGAALEAALVLARRDIDPELRVDFTIIAMGKCGTQELNYMSDADILYVVGTKDGVEKREAAGIDTRLAAMAAQACSGSGAEQPLWTIDANLRPEGRNGALVRALESYESYWNEWAQSWKFQTLLKTCCAAEDLEFGNRFHAVAAQYVWTAAGHPGFVENARAIRRRIEENIPRREADRNLKLDRGGLRGVEFTVQLLQLAYGRSDESLRVRLTIDAPEALRAGGCIARKGADELEECYRFLRSVEHRTQIAKVHRTYLIPTSTHEVHVIGRSLDLDAFFDTEAFISRLERVRARARELREEVFYRLTIQAIAGLSLNVAALDEEGAHTGLEVIGYIGPNGTFPYISALARGTSRRAMIQRHLSPVFISWFVDGADPNLGLLSFRTLSEQIGDSHWYLTLLHSSGVAAFRLCQMLPNSEQVAEALSSRPEAIAWLDSDRELEASDPQALKGEAVSLINRRANPKNAASRVRAVRSRELLQAAMSDLYSAISPRRPIISDATDIALLGAPATASREDEKRHGRARAEVGLVAMGRYRSREFSYASDADVIACHRNVGEASEVETAESATAIINRVKALLGSATTQMSISVDFGFRPEGRSGPITRTPHSYADYYGKWASAWERQAPLRTHPIAGPEPLLEEVMVLIGSIRYGSPVTKEELKEIRLLKARMESERLSRDAESKRHVKFRRGRLSDIERIVQLLQLRYGPECLMMRTTPTLDAPRTLRKSGRISFEDASTLEDAWSLASRIRAGNVLTSEYMSGVKLDTLPRDLCDLKPLACTPGYRAGYEGDVEGDRMRCARRAREVMDRPF